MEALVGYYPCVMAILTRTTNRGGRQCQGQFDWGGRLLKGNGGAQRFPQNGWKSFEECKAEGSLTARPTSRAGTKVGLSDPAVLNGKAVAQRIKATLGITG